MAESQAKIYQLRITILFTEDEIWRSILVPENYTFWDLNVAIKDVFEIPSCQRHFFHFGDNISRPLERIVLHGVVGPQAIDGRNAVLCDYLVGTEINFVEESVDGWTGWCYLITLEYSSQRAPGEILPRCIDGEWANPPPYITNAAQLKGYLDIIVESEKMQDISELEERLQEFLDDEDFVWDDYDVNYFDPTKVEFSNLN